MTMQGVAGASEADQVTSFNVQIGNILKSTGDKKGKITELVNAYLPELNRVTESLTLQEAGLLSAAASLIIPLNPQVGNQVAMLAAKVLKKEADRVGPFDISRVMELPLLMAIEDTKDEVQKDLKRFLDTWVDTWRRLPTKDALITSYSRLIKNFRETQEAYWALAEKISACYGEGHPEVVLAKVMGAKSEVLQEIERQVQQEMQKV